jgi:GTP cyclohydrolase I
MNLETDVDIDLDVSDIINHASKEELREIVSETFERYEDIYNEWIHTVETPYHDEAFDNSYFQQKMKDIFQSLIDNQRTLDINQLEDLKQTLVKQNYI